jgi:hypothetical protein
LGNVKKKSLEFDSEKQVNNVKTTMGTVWHLASSSGFLPIKLCPWVENWPQPGVQKLFIDLYWKKMKIFSK